MEAGDDGGAVTVTVVIIQETTSDLGRLLILTLFFNIEVRYKSMNKQYLNWILRTESMQVIQMVLLYGLQNN